MQKLNVSFPSRRVPAGTVEIPVTINGHEYFTYMAPGACNLRTFYGINNINKHSVHPAEILAAIVLSGIGGSIMVFTDAYGHGADAEALKAYVDSQEDLVKGGCSMVVANGGINPYMGHKVVGAILDYNLDVLRAWYTKTFGDPTQDGWVANQRVNMDAIFYQYGGRPHAARSSDADRHLDLDKSLELSRAKLSNKAA